MKDEKFTIKSYGKSELAMKYFPNDSPEVALKKLRNWLNINPILRKLKPKRAKIFTPKQVKIIVKLLGEPFDIE
jgi:hypothetical protein